MKSSDKVIETERFPRCSDRDTGDGEEAVLRCTMNITLRGNEERLMEYGFGVAGLNGCMMHAISSDGTACYSGNVFDREQTGRKCRWIRTRSKTCRGLYREVQMN